MKKGLILIIGFLILLMAGKDSNFLPKSQEINQLDLVRALALDKGSKPHEIKLSVLLEKKEQGGGGGGGGSGGGGGEKAQAKVLTEESESAAGAERAFHAYNDKQLFYGHATYFIIGQDAASENILQYIDFFLRDNEIRPSGLVYIAKGEGKAILDGSETFLPDKLRGLTKSVENLSVSREMPMYEMMAELADNNFLSLAIPTIYLKEMPQEESMQSANGTSGGQASSSKPKVETELGGFGIIKHYKLVGFIDNRLSLAFNLLRNKVSSAIINVNDLAGETVAMEIISARTKITPVVDGEVVKGFKIESKLHVNGDEVHSSINNSTEEYIRYVESQNSLIVKQEIEDLIKYVKENRADFISFGNKLGLTHQELWNKIKNKWEDLIPSLTFDVEVQTQLMRSYNIKEPLGYEAGEGE